MASSSQVATLSENHLIPSPNKDKHRRPGKTAEKTTIEYPPEETETTHCQPQEFHPKEKGRNHVQLLIFVASTTIFMGEIFTQIILA